MIVKWSSITPRCSDVVPMFATAASLAMEMVSFAIREIFSQQKESPTQKVLQWCSISVRKENLQN